MLKINKLGGFLIFMLLGIVFISCGKPKDIIDKGYILKVGVSDEIDKEFAGKMEHSPTYTVFEATEYKDNDIMVQNLKNGTVALQPGFCSVTFGAGGSTQDGTLAAVREILAEGMPAS